MHSRKKVIYLLIFSAVILLFYLFVQYATDLYREESTSDNLMNPDTAMKADELKAEVSNRVDISTETNTSEQVADYAKEFLNSYHQANPEAYPVVSGQMDLLGNAWGYVMWDGEKSEIVLIYYDTKTNAIQERSIVISKDSFTKIPGE